MRKLALLFLILLFSRTQSPAQALLKDIAGSYFRINPYDGEFSKFLSLVMNDPEVFNKIVYKRTDSNFFYFKGEYKNYNPFFFKASRVEITIAETEVTIDDSTGKLDTIIVYQLLGYTAAGKQGEDDVKQEFSRFQKKMKRKYWSQEPENRKEGTEITGQLQNYFLLPYPNSPLSTAWGKLSDPDEYVFAITIRMKVKENMAILP